MRVLELVTYMSAVGAVLDCGCIVETEINYFTTNLGRCESDYVLGLLIHLMNEVLQHKCPTPEPDHDFAY